MRQELFDGLHVWWLPIGLLIAVSSAWWSSRRHQHTNWSGVPTGLPRSWRQKTRWVPRSLGWLALILLLFGLAGPRGVREHREVTGEGLAITLCVDRSGRLGDPAEPVGCGQGCGRSIYSRRRHHGRSSG